MKCRTSVIVAILVPLLAVLPMGILSIVLNRSSEPTLRLLLVSGVGGEDWDRTVTGAKAAAQALGLELSIRTPTGGNQPEQQMAMLRNIDIADHDGVAVCPTANEAQIEFINKIARRIKLITIGTDADMPNRLSSVGFCPNASGRKTIRMVGDALPDGGKILALTTLTSDASQNIKGNGRLIGFQEGWAQESSTSRHTIVSVKVDRNNSSRTAAYLAASVADPEPALIIAFDAQAAECALTELARHPPTKHIPFIAFDPTAVILEAIDNGLVDSAICEDPYRNGYDAVARLANLCRRDRFESPTPGKGSSFLSGEVVTKANVNSFRKKFYFRHVSRSASKTIGERYGDAG